MKSIVVLLVVCAVTLLTWLATLLVTRWSKSQGRSRPPASTRRIAFVAIALGALFVATVASGVVPWWSTGPVGAAAATLAGWLLAQRLGSRGALATFLITASLVDAYSVFFGPTQRLLGTTATRSPLVLHLAISIPWDEGALAVIGLADVFGLAVIFGALLALGTSRWATLAVGLVGATAAVASGLWLGPLPAFPFLTLPVLLLLWRGAK